MNLDFAVDLVLGDGFPFLGSAVGTGKRIATFIETSVFARLDPFLE